jgi:hypothetical protein
MRAATLRRNKKLPKWLDKLSLNKLWLASSISLNLSLGQSLVSCGNISALELLTVSLWVVLALAYFSSYSCKNNWWNKLQHRSRRFGLYPVVWLVSFLLWFGDILALPSFAQAAGGGGGNAFFFQNIQQKVKEILSTNGDAAGAVDIIDFGFGILQLAMILYIAFAIFQAVKAHQQDEEWIQSAKVPLIILFAVTAGDFAVGLIA